MIARVAGGGRRGSRGSRSRIGSSAWCSRCSRPRRASEVRDPLHRARLRRALRPRRPEREPRAQFERDKDDIRELGIPLETVESPDRPGDNQALRYRIPKGLRPARRGARSPPTSSRCSASPRRSGARPRSPADSQRALTKLRSLGIEPRDPSSVTRRACACARPRSSRCARPSTAARRVRFRYFKPGEGQPRERTVDPLAVVLHEGRWHLHAFDRDAKGPRTFLLSRIVGPSSSSPAPRSTRRRPGIQDRILAELDELRQGNVADLRVSRAATPRCASASGGRSTRRGGRRHPPALHGCRESSPTSSRPTVPRCVSPPRRAARPCASA